METPREPELSLLRAMLDAVEQQVWALDPVSFELLAWNAAAAAHIRRWRGVELRRGLALADVLPAAVHELWAPRLREALGAQRPIGFETALHAFEPSWVEIRRVARGDDVLALVCTSKRVTSERGEAFFSKVLADSADITSVLARDGRRIYISSGVTKVLGLTVEEGLSTPVAQSTHPEDQARVLATFRKLIAEPGSTARLRFRQRHKNGSYVLVDALTRNALEDPDVNGVVVTTRDVTEQVALESRFLQAQKLESVGRLAGGVAHDFNNLLTVILSSAELLQLEGAALTGTHLEYVDEIRAAAERARDLTRQLLAFARKQSVAPVPMDLNAHVAATKKMLARMLGEDITLTAHLAPALWLVRCDPGQVDQILLNLAVNSRDAMPSGGRFEVRTRNLPADPRAGTSDQVVLEVADTGVGMEPSVLEHAFEPFFTTKEVGKGTGLGLATVHGIVEQHGGTVELESSPGEGTRFVFRFPRCTGDVRRLDAPSESLVRGHETILVVEDDPLVRGLEARALTGAGYQVVLASDGEDALERLRSWDGPLHLLLTDVVMPHLDGVALEEAARVLRPTLPVLFTSGYADDRVAKNKLTGPHVAFLPKPFTPTELLERVRAVMDDARH